MAKEKEVKKEEIVVEKKVLDDNSVKAHPVIK